MTISDTPGEGLVERLNERAVSYDQSGPSAQHTARLLREAAEAIAALSRAPEAVAVKPGFVQVPLSPSRAQIETLASRWGYTTEEAADTYEVILGETAALATPPTPQPALALIEELERALEAMLDIKNGDEREKARAALASAKRFKGA